jgi:ketosteroid isomerase-like protein
MAGELETAVRAVMSAYDRQAWEALSSLFTDDAQGVDELSRKWMRGRQQMNAYFNQFGPMLSDIRSDLSDFHEMISGDLGVATLWAEQDYKVNGDPVHFSGPITMVFKREGGTWKATVVHAVPMPRS